MSSTGSDRGMVLQQLDRLFRDGTLAGLGDGQLLERYRTRRDEAAFAALVELHGPMVLGLCRRYLRDPRDIEDAFQATFLVLVRKAAGIRDGGLLANWLYGVAVRAGIAGLAIPFCSCCRTREQAYRCSRGRSFRGYRSMLGIGICARSGIEQAAGEVSCSAGVVLLTRANSRPGRGERWRTCPVGTVLKPDGPRAAHLLKRRSHSPGICANRRPLRSRPRPDGTSPHRDHASPPGRSHGRSSLRNRLIANTASGRCLSDRPRNDPRSSHVHETCTIEMDRPRRGGHRPLGRRGRRSGRRQGTGPPWSAGNHPRAGRDHKPAGSRVDGNRFDNDPLHAILAIDRRATPRPGKPDRPHLSLEWDHARV